MKQERRKITAQMICELTQRTRQETDCLMEYTNIIRTKNAITITDGG